MGIYSVSRVYIPSALVLGWGNQPALADGLGGKTVRADSLNVGL